MEQQPYTLYQTILADKSLTPDEIQKEFLKLCSYQATENKRCFAGNPLLYHFMLDVLCQVQTKKGMSIKGEAESEERRQYWYAQMLKVKRTGTFAVRFFEVLRVCQVAINFFKPTIAKFLYRKFKATSVLDPCAGWGGRLLGAMALDGVRYTGFDTNPLLMKPYRSMVRTLLPKCKHFQIEADVQEDIWKQKDKAYRMIWGSSLDYPFDDLEYDFVLTSPPYVNLEVYPGMTPFESEKIFYEQFLIPLIDKCRKHCKSGGRVCFNISPAMYAALTDKFKYRACDEREEMLQQIRFGKNKADQIYIWRC